MAMYNLYSNFNTGVYAASLNVWDDQRDNLPPTIDFSNEILQKTTKFALGWALGTASAIVEYHNRAADGQITIRDALAVGMSVPGGILGGVVGVGTAQALGYMGVAATGPVGLLAGSIIAAGVVLGGELLAYLVDTIPNPMLDTVLWSTNTPDVRDYHFIPSVDPINPYGYLQSMNYGDIGFTGYTGNNTGLDSPSEGQTMRPGTNPALHTIADARAQERDYANSQGSRPSVNPKDTYKSVLDDIHSNTGSIWGTGGSGSGGSGSGHRDEGSRPGPGQTLSGGSGRSDGGSGSGGSTDGSGSSVSGGRGTPSPTTGGSTPSRPSTPSNPRGVDNDYGRNNPPSRPSTPSTPSRRSDPADPGRVGPQPVLLDLDSNGFDISTLDTSNTFVAMDETGLLTRMAWARGQDGVLVIDANGDGKISSSKEFAFTEWANGARTDFEALKQVFDTNGNGKLDNGILNDGVGGDARFGEFRVSVNGQLVTLASLGIASINLTPTGSGQVFADGSAITGTATFTRTNGTTGLAGDAILAAEARGYLITRSAVTSANGTVTTTTEGRNRDGALAFREIVAVSADGKTTTSTMDDDGNSTVERSQIITSTTDAAGTVTRLVKDFDASGTLIDQTKTKTSANGQSVTTSLDVNGDNHFVGTQV